MVDEPLCLCLWLCRPQPGVNNNIPLIKTVLQGWADSPGDSLVSWTSCVATVAAGENTEHCLTSWKKERAGGFSSKVPTSARTCWKQRWQNQPRSRISDYILQGPVNFGGRGDEGGAKRTIKEETQNISEDFRFPGPTSWISKQSLLSLCANKDFL
jgi:hypothetical protein